MELGFYKVFVRFKVHLVRAFAALPHNVVVSLVLSAKWSVIASSSDGIIIYVNARIIFFILKFL